MATWQSCCRGRKSNCPQVLVEGRTIHVRDDDGNRIKLTLDQLQDVHFKVTEIVTQRRPPTSADTAPMGLFP